MKWIIAIIVVVLFVTPSFAEVTYLNMYPHCQTIEQLFSYTVAIVADAEVILDNLNKVCGGLLPEETVENATFDVLYDHNGIMQLLVSEKLQTTVIWTFSNNTELFEVEL